MNTASAASERPAWENLSPEIQQAWRQSLLDFYPEGSIPAADLDSTSRTEYNMAETLMPAQFVPVPIAGLVSAEV
jgi:hypothetical protein